MMIKFPAPKKSIIYEDKKVGVCLASRPLARGHIIVFWKKDAKDIHNLSDREYDYLMRLVDVTRDSLLKYFKVKKVYLLYMDELKHVHWHLVPRYNVRGINALAHSPRRETNFRDVPALAKIFLSIIKKRKGFK